MQMYIVDLADYNEGRSTGEWINIEGMDENGIYDMITEFLESTGGEEWAIHDYDDCPNMGEHPDLEVLGVMADADDDTRDAMAAWLANGCSLNSFKNAFIGFYEDEEDYAYEYIQDHYDLDNMMGELSSYFDYEAFTKDLFCGGMTGIDTDSGFAVFNDI